MKGTVIDLGATALEVKGEDQVHQMQVIDSGNLACELHGAEIEEWQEARQAPVKYLKKALGMSPDDVLHTWGRRCYRNNKQVQQANDADSIFVMLRVKACAIQTILKQAIPGVYCGPRTEDGQPHLDYKVIPSRQHAL